MKYGFLISTLFASVTCLALQPQDPKSLCDRFLGSDQTACEKKMTELKPDWYLATVCNRQFDDKLFYDCVLKGVRNTFSPVALQACDSDELGDTERMSCIDAAKTPMARSFQDEKISRKPASLPNRPKHQK